jgi:hypothetical protein
MNLRIHRTWAWELAIPASEVKMGGNNPMELVATDVVEYLDTLTNEWTPLPIVSEPVPEHPRLTRERANLENFRKAVQTQIERTQRVTGDPSKGVTVTPTGVIG